MRRTLRAGGIAFIYEMLMLVYAPEFSHDVRIAVICSTAMILFWVLR